MSIFDSVRGDVLPGGDWVLRMPGVVAVVNRQEADGSALELIRLIMDSVADLGPSSGRELGLRITRWLVGNRNIPGFGTVAATPDGIAVLLHGDASLREIDIPGRPQRGVHFSGCSAALVVDRLLAWPSLPLALTLGSGAICDLAPVDGVPAGSLGLIAGLVPGRGVVLGTAAAEAAVLLQDPAARSVSAGDELIAQSPGALSENGPAQPPPGDQGHPGPPTLPPKPARRPDGGSAPRVGRHAARQESPRLPAPDHQSAIDDGSGPPMPLADRSPDATTRSHRVATHPVLVKGVLCSREHLNDPRVAFCGSCGIRMDHRTAVLVAGPRPPIGLLLMDDGAIHVLDGGLLLGRRPEIDPAVTDGSLQPIRLEDATETISRSHADIQLRDWDAVLTDRGSANGTLIAEPAGAGWIRLPAHQPHILEPGTRVRIGERTMTFQSARAEL